MPELPAPAKVNLHLKVTGLRDDGYHLLDTSFAYVDVADRLTIEAANDLQVTCSTAHLEGRQNLVHRLLAAMQKEFEVEHGVHAHVEKHLPEQAGLGGGSSDAATALLAVNAMWGLHLDRQALIDFTVPFGADIPCFLFGHASRATGVGEHLARLEAPLPAGHLVLAHPGVGLSTAEVFRRFDAENRAQLTLRGGEDTIRAESRDGAEARTESDDITVGENDLEATACDLCPPLAHLLQAMREDSVTAWMSGSGTACAALLAERDQAEALASRLHDQGLATWTHVGNLLAEHPLAANSQNMMIGA